MAKIIKDTIRAKGIDIGIYTTDYENEFISLTDIARYKSAEVLPHSLVIRWCSDTLILPQAIVYYSVHTWYA